MCDVVTKERLEKLKTLRLLDDDYAKIAFNDVNCIIEVVSTVKHEKIEIIHHETEAVLKMIAGRSIECDVLVLTKDKAIDLELQKTRLKSLPKRMRFHSSAVDTSVSKPQQEFGDLLDIIVIFICEFDFVGKGEPIYHVKRYVEETMEVFDDGMELILVNCTYQGDDKIGRLIHDLKCTDPNDMYNPILKERNKYFKEDEEGQIIMCEAWEEERREGDITRMIASVISLMETMNLSLEDAMNALKLTEEEKQICIERLK